MQESHRTTQENERSSPRTILVVDDETGIRRGCERVLRSEGHTVMLAERGDQGLEILRAHPEADLVLVDLRMPGMSGFEFLDRARDLAPESVLVVITAYATLESAVEATKRGAYDFIAKPFTPDDLLRVVNRAIERASLLRERNRLEAERRQRLLELAEGKSQLRTVIDSMADAVLVCNAEETIVLFNPAALKLFAALPSPAGPLPLSEALCQKELAGLIREASTGRKRLSNEIMIAAGPPPQWALANIAPVIDRDSGRFLGTVSVLRDITDLKRVEQLKAQFVNMVAHELRAPLAAVDGYLEAMESGYIADAEKRLSVIQRSRRRIASLLDLVSDLLSMARLEAGTVRRTISAQAIEAIVGEVVELMQPLAGQNGVTLNLSCERTAAPVEADKEELVRLFTNLVSNAIKYNKKGGSVDIAVRQEGPYVTVSVEDTGVGISPEGLERLFSEFFREKRNETSHVTGTGLGLSIVKRIVDFYHGRIEVSSRLGQGTRFVVRLPCKREESQARPD